MKIQLLGANVKSKSVNASAQSRQNLYLDVVPGGGDKAQIVAYGTPGLVQEQDLGAERCRATPHWFQAINRMYFINRDQLIEIDASGVAVVRGTLASDVGTANLADNGSQLLITDGTDGYIYTPNVTAPRAITTSTHSTTTATITTNGSHGLQVGQLITRSGATPTAYNGDFRVESIPATNQFTYTMASDPGADASPAGSYTVSAFQAIANYPGGLSATFLAGFFVANKPQTGQFYVSAWYNGFSWSALDYATAESTPDDLSRVIAHNGTLLLLGDISTEFWAPNGGVLFPFGLVANAVESWGCIAPWSAAICGDLVIFLGQNRRGGVSVVGVSGYTCAPISSPDLDVELATYPAASDAVAFGYRSQGHDFYQINFRAAAKSWLYDATSGVWSVVSGYGLSRHRAEFGATFANVPMVTDYENGTIYSLDPTAYTDNGQPIERKLRTPHVYDADGLNQIIVSRLRVDMETGVGLATDQGSDPKIMLRISRDGGHSWGGELWVSLGKVGEYLTVAEWRRLGIARDWVFELTLTDSVKPVFLSAYVEAQKANK